MNCHVIKKSQIFLFHFFLSPLPRDWRFLIRSAQVEQDAQLHSDVDVKKVKEEKTHKNDIRKNRP